MRRRPPAEAVEDAEFVMMCVGNDDDVREVHVGRRRSARRDGERVDPRRPHDGLGDVARQLAAACAERGVGFVDAPVSGGQAGAENGQLTVMCGCDDEAVFDRARVVIDAYARRASAWARPVPGSRRRWSTRSASPGCVQGLAEGVDFAQRAGLDVDQVVDVIGKGAAQSWQMDNRARTMAAGEFEFGFAVEWMRKDLGICLDEAERNDARLPVTALVDQFYKQIVERGGDRWDTSSLVESLQHP